MNHGEKKLRGWDSLEAEEQTDLRVAFGRYMDTLPPTCSLEAKVERFRSWLQCHEV